MKFVIIPKEIITNKELDSKRVLVFISAVSTMSPDIERLIKFAGLSYDRHRNGVANSFAKNLQYFVDKGYFTPNNGKLLYNCPPHSFGTIDNREVVQIIEAGKARKNFSQSHLLLVLAYVRANMIREQGLEYHSNLLKRMASDIGISKRTLERQIDNLEELQILHTEKLPRYQTPGGLWHTNVRLFVDENDNRQEMVDKATAKILAVQREAKENKMT